MTRDVLPIAAALFSLIFSHFCHLRIWPGNLKSQLWLLMGLIIPPTKAAELQTPNKLKYTQLFGGILKGEFAILLLSWPMQLPPSIGPAFFPNPHIIYTYYVSISCRSLTSSPMRNASIHATSALMGAPKTTILGCPHSAGPHAEVGCSLPISVLHLIT